MKENATYKTPDGLLKKVLMFDELNKMVYVNIIGTRHEWIHESEYSKWVVNDTAEMPKIYVPDIPAQMTEEQISSQSKTEIEPMEQGVSESEELTQESENTVEEEVVKPKRKYNKK